MQSASPTPKDLKIQPRNVMFARNKGTDRWWNSRNPIATAFYNSLSLTFPKGEAFFIDSVRHYRNAVPAELQSQIDDFIKQEAAHSREHGVFNGQVERTGYDTALTGIATAVRRRYVSSRL
jgi:predicted metal-dependent hydrolase